MGSDQFSMINGHCITGFFVSGLALIIDYFPLVMDVFKEAL